MVPFFAEYRRFGTEVESRQHQNNFKGPTKRLIEETKGNKDTIDMSEHNSHMV